MPRPRRTRLYDANYQIGESYYKSALDRLDRKYSGRPLDPPVRSPSIPREVEERYSRAFPEDGDDLFSARRRAEKLISEENVFDSRGAIIPRGKSLGASFDGAVDNDIDEEISIALKRIRANKKVALEDTDLEGATSNLRSKLTLSLGDKMLDSVGLNEVRRMQSNESQSISKARRSFVDDIESSLEAPSARWSALKSVADDEDFNTGAALRAQQSRARLQDLEEEMETINQKQAAREKRLANLKKVMAESEDDFGLSNVSSQQGLHSAMKSTRAVSSLRAEKKTVTF